MTLTAGVPTLWLGMLTLLDRERYDLSSVRMMIVGGAAAPQSMIEAYEKRHGIEVMHAWGMTETSPLGTVSRLRSWHERARRGRAGSPSAPSRARRCRAWRYGQ